MKVCDFSRRAVPLALAVAATVTVGLAPSAQAVTRAPALRYLTISLPHAGFTVVNDINDAGVMVGNFGHDSESNGYILAGTRVTPVAFPGAAGRTSLFTINRSGTTVGIYTDRRGVTHGFLRSPGGTFTALNDPHAGTGKGQGTLPQGLNDQGTVVGYYVTSGGVAQGFRYRAGRFTTITVPGAGAGPNQGTMPVSINDANTIVGSYVDPHNVGYGFVLTTRQFISFTAPGAGRHAGQGTFPIGLNNNGAIVGEVVGPSGINQGFLLRAWRFQQLNDPHAGSGPNQGTVPEGINDHDAVVGIFFPQHHPVRGFLVYLRSQKAYGSIEQAQAPVADGGAGPGVGNPRAVTPLLRPGHPGTT